MERGLENNSLAQLQEPSQVEHKNEIPFRGGQSILIAI